MAKYDASFWRRVLARARPADLIGTLLRMVENQEQKVTVPLVDTFEEHEVLESLLDESKPAPPLAAELSRLDYLLRTPWRYPPLAWGSRFGRRFEPNIFYGSLSHGALYAEAAYYRLLFLDGMQTPFKNRVISQHTIFEAQYQTDTGFDLTRTPFAKHSAALRHKARYAPCQELGTELRARGVTAISYFSARASGDELNVALFSPGALRSRRHRKPRHGLCETRSEGVSLLVGEELHRFSREQFLYRGRVPQPA